MGYTYTLFANTSNICRDIRDCAAETAGTNSYFAVSMQPIYQRASDIKKKPQGKDFFTPTPTLTYRDANLCPGVRNLRTARQTVLESGLKAQDGPFHQLHVKIFEELTLKLNAHRDGLIEETQTILNEIQREIDLYCTKKEDNSPEAKKLREELLAVHAVARKRANEELRPKLDEALQMCKRMRESRDDVP